MIEYLVSGVSAVISAYMFLNAIVSIKTNDGVHLYTFIYVAIGIVFALMSIIQFVEVYKTNNTM